VATFGGYAAYKRYNYSAGVTSARSVNVFLEFADSLNAKQMAEVNRLFEQSEKSGSLDVERLGELAQLERELQALARGEDASQSRLALALGGQRYRADSTRIFARGSFHCAARSAQSRLGCT
jgi:hypothetical protein